MTDNADEILERLRRVNPVADDPANAGVVDDALLGIGPLPSRRWRPRHRHLVTDSGIDTLLRAANPYPASAVDRLATSPEGALFESLIAGPTRRRRGRRLRSPRGFAVAIVATASLVASAFGYVFAERNVTDASSVRCYELASLGSHYVGITPGSDGPISSCRAEVWSAGSFGSPRTPLLVGCVLANGVEAVFPGNDDATCTQLGLSAVRSRTATAERLQELQALLVTGLNPETRCLTPARARSVALDDLTRTEFRSWTVRVSPGTSSARPCTQAYVLATTEMIELDPFPRLVDHRPLTQPTPEGSRY